MPEQDRFSDLEKLSQDDALELAVQHRMFDLGIINAIDAAVTDLNIEEDKQEEARRKIILIAEAAYLGAYYEGMTDSNDENILREHLGHQAIE